MRQQILRPSDCPDYNTGTSKPSSEGSPTDLSVSSSDSSGHSRISVVEFSIAFPFVIANPAGIGASSSNAQASAVIVRSAIMIAKEAITSIKEIITATHLAMSTIDR